MHEMALTESLIEIAVEEAVKRSAKRIVRVWLEVGMLSHAEPEALRFCFDAVAAGTLAEGARLEMDRPPGAGLCIDCGKCVALEERFGACPECGRYGVRMTSGDELKLLELEIE